MSTGIHSTTSHSTVILINKRVYVTEIRSIITRISGTNLFMSSSEISLCHVLIIDHEDVTNHRYMEKLASYKGARNSSNSLKH